MRARNSPFSKWEFDFLESMREQFDDNDDKSLTTTTTTRVRL
jgi:hypothetical protein